MGRNQEIEVAQNLRPEAVSQSDIFEPNQASAPWGHLETTHPGRSQ
jgi:hypothetical protein